MTAMRRTLLTSASVATLAGAAAGIAARANGGSALDMVEATGRTRIEPAGSLFEAP